MACIVAAQEGDVGVQLFGDVDLHYVCNCCVGEWAAATFPSIGVNWCHMAASLNTACVGTVVMRVMQGWWSENFLSVGSLLQ